MQRLKALAAEYPRYGYPVGHWRTWLDLYSFWQADRLGLIQQVYGGIQGVGVAERFPFRDKVQQLYRERMADDQKKFAIT